MASAPSSGAAGGALPGGRAVGVGLVPRYLVPRHLLAGQFVAGLLVPGHAVRGRLAVDRRAGSRVAPGRRIVIRGRGRNLATAARAAGELVIGGPSRHRVLVARLGRVAEQVTEQSAVVDHGLPQVLGRRGARGSLLADLLGGAEVADGL